MTDENTAGTDADGVDWGEMDPPVSEAPAGAYAPPTSYPQWPDNPHNHRFTISFDGRGPMIVVRGNTRQEIIDGYNELDAEVGAIMGNCWLAVKSAAQLVQGVGPATSAPPPAAPTGPPPGAVPPPQQNYPSGPPQPSQGPPPAWAAPPTPGYQQAAPQGGGGWGGGGGRTEPKPRPAGWAAVDVPYNDKDRFKALRAAGTESGNYLRGKVQWGGKGMYWLDPSVAGWLAQQGFPVTQ